MFCSNKTEGQAQQTFFSGFNWSKNHIYRILHMRIREQTDKMCVTGIKQKKTTYNCMRKEGEKRNRSTVHAARMPDRHCFELIEHKLMVNICPRKLTCLV